MMCHVWYIVLDTLYVMCGTWYVACDAMRRDAVRRGVVRRGVVCGVVWCGVVWCDAHSAASRPGKETDAKLKNNSLA